MSREPAPAARCLAVWSVASLATGLLLTWLLPPLMSAAAPVGGFEEWLVVACEAGAALGTAWIWVLVTLVALEARGRTSRRHPGVPPAVRRLVLAACGAGLVGGLVAPAHADTAPSPLAGLPLPDRPTSHAPVRPGDSPDPSPVAAAGRPPQRSQTVRVAAGDSLWRLAVADLPDDAPPADVDERWRAIHAANREVIGDDPDLILPGQQLRLPPSAPTT